MKKENFFWVSYADLMTSLFFIMLVLYVITFILLRTEMDKIEADAKKLKEIESVEKALQDLDDKYFEFDKINKRYKLKVDAIFGSNSDNIYDNNHISKSDRDEIYQAGRVLYKKIHSIISTNKNVDYLLIIEGNTQRSNNNWLNNPDGGYKLSYRRALALYNFWKEKGLDFRELGTQCEIIIAGSGYFSQSRDTKDENHNRRFTIQITSKVGKFIQQ